MNKEQLLIKLYYLIVSVDGNIDQKESELGKKMISHEQIEPTSFYEELEELKMRDRDLLYTESLKEIHALEPDTRIRYMAWMTLIANADGFMDEGEWQFIYRLYHKELKISLTDIMNEQKKLSKLVRNLRPVV